jgi:hypothetical protein
MLSLEYGFDGVPWVATLKYLRFSGSIESVECTYSSTVVEARDFGSRRHVSAIAASIADTVQWTLPLSKTDLQNGLDGSPNQKCLFRPAEESFVAAEVK